MRSDVYVAPLDDTEEHQRVNDPGDDRKDRPEADPPVHFARFLDALARGETALRREEAAGHEPKNIQDPRLRAPAEAFYRTCDDDLIKFRIRFRMDAEGHDQV
eukprot:SAG31_NODE_2313_length_5956_cov_3.390302_9_plen_103_part_00